MRKKSCYICIKFTQILVLTQMQNPQQIFRNFCSVEDNVKRKEIQDTEQGAMFAKDMSDKELKCF